MSGFSIFIVEDDTPLRRSLELLAEGLGVRVRGFPSAEDFLKTDSDGQVGCLLTDVNLPGASGVALIEHLRRKQAPIVSIVLTGSEDSDLAFRAGRAGAIAFFRKPAAPDRLRGSLQRSLELLLKHHGSLRRRHEVAERAAHLTTRERKILQLVGSGSRNGTIASKLKISTKTVGVHRTRLMRKANAGSQAGLALFALELERLEWFMGLTHQTASAL
ncbi:MAG: response regulator [Planctomycetota bacterium]